MMINSSLIQCVLWVSVYASIVAIFALGVRFLLHKSMSPGLAYLFWILVTLRFVLFLAPESPTSFLNLVKPAPSNSIVTISESTASFDHLWSNVAIAEPVQASLENLNVVEATRSFNLWPWLTFIWLAGLAILLFRLLQSYRLVRKIKTESIQNPQRQAQLDRLADELGIKRKVRIGISDAVKTPAMTGTISPFVLMPRWCTEELDQQQLDLVLLHELIHVRRYDALIQLLAHITAIIHWFNPIMLVVLRFIESSKELSCDQAVIKTLKSNDKHPELNEQRYGETILAIAEKQGRFHPKPCSVFLGGFTGNNNNLIKQRIAMMVNTNSKRNLGTLMPSFAIIVLLAVGFTNAQSPVEQQATSQEPTHQRANEANEKADSAKLPLGTILPNPVQYTLSEAGSTTNVNNTKVNVGSSKRLTFEYKVPEILVNEPKVLSVTPVSPTEILITGLKCGTANVQVMNSDREKETVKVDVLPNIAHLFKRLKTEFPEANIQVKAEPTFIVLTGTANSNDVESILKASEHQLGLQDTNVSVINRIAINDYYVATQVKVIEVSRTKLKELGVDWSSIGVQKQPAGITDVLAECLGQRSGSMVLTGVVDDTPFLPFVDALRKQNIAKLIDQPVLVAKPGKVVEFFSGKEIPYVREQAKNGVNIMDFKAVGNRLKINAMTSSDEKIILNIYAEFSELVDIENSAQRIPNIRMRSVDTGLQLTPGQTVALAGGFTSDKDENKEMLILIKPKLILNPEALAKKPENAAAEFLR